MYLLIFCSCSSQLRAIAPSILSFDMWLPINSANIALSIDSRAEEVSVDCSFIQFPSVHSLHPWIMDIDFDFDTFL